MKALIKTEYRVKFRYYQYNSGAADNGSFLTYKSFPDFDAAMAFKTKMMKSIEAYHDAQYEISVSKWGEDLVNDLTPLGGYLIQEEPSIDKVVCQTTPVGDEDEVIPNSPDQWLGWIEKRTPLDNLQRDYVLFAINNILEKSKI